MNFEFIDISLNRKYQMTGNSDRALELPCEILLSN